MKHSCNIFSLEMKHLEIRQQKVQNTYCLNTFGYSDLENRGYYFHRSYQCFVKRSGIYHLGAMTCSKASFCFLQLSLKRSFQISLQALQISKAIYSLLNIHEQSTEARAQTSALDSHNKRMNQFQHYQENLPQKIKTNFLFKYEYFET